MENTNMDHKANPNSNVPQLEFSIPENEVKADLAVGDIGFIRIPVEVTQRKDGMVSFRKSGAAEGSDFTDANIAELRKHLPKAER